jgi:hypothetical protein
MEWLVFLVGFVLLIAAPAIVIAPLLMYFSKTLTFFQSLRILAAGFAVMGLVSVTFAYVLPTAAFGLSTLVAACLAGAIITRMAAREGVAKRGLLGVGAKSVLSLLLLSWVVVGVLYLAGAF